MFNIISCWEDKNLNPPKYYFKPIKISNICKIYTIAKKWSMKEEIDNPVYIIIKTSALQ